MTTIYMVEDLFKARALIDKKWEVVEAHYNQAYKKTGFQFKARPADHVVELLYRKLLELRRCEENLSRFKSLAPRPGSAPGLHD